MSAELDAQLVSKALQGDVSAFEEIVERYRAPLVALAAARLGSFADGEDIAQEAFVRVYFHLHELRNPEALLPWLRKTTDRLALMRLRSRREETASLEQIETAAPDNGQDILADIEAQSLLSRLPTKMQETVILTTLSGYTCAEAAGIMGVKEGTVKSRLNRARAHLREVLEMTQNGMGETSGSEFTRKTIERLKREARKLVAEGKFLEAKMLAEEILIEQVKPLYGDPRELGIAKTFLAAYESGAFKSDPDATAILGLPQREQRRHEAEQNASQYGFRLEELDWTIADVDMMSGTLGKPTGQGKDTWGVPVSKLDLTIIDARELCQRLRCSPLALYAWVMQGCPVLRCWPFARYDLDKVKQWISDNGITEWQQEARYMLERPIRVMFREVYEGRLSPEQAVEIMEALGYGAWEAPIEFTGGWN